MIALFETATRLIITGEEKPLNKLRLAFRYHPKQYFRADSYQLWKMTNGERGWDGYRYPLVLKTPTAGEILRGRKEELLDLCQQNGYAVDTSKLLPSPFGDLSADEITDDLITSSFTLDHNQRAAIVEWLRRGMGVAHMAVNAGKTATFAAAAAKIKTQFPDARFLYFTFTERLVTQVYAAMTEFLPGWHITQYGGGGKRDASGADMVVATQAILNRNFNALEREGYFKTFMALLLDESHHCQSPTAEKVLRACSAYFRLGASDSTKESDPDKWNKIQGLCGPICYEVSSSELIASGRSAAPTLYLVDVPSWKGRFRHDAHEVSADSEGWTLVGTEWVPIKYLGPVYEREDGKIKTKSRAYLEGDTWKREEIPVTVPSLHRVELDGQETEVAARYTILNRRYDNAIIMFDERNDLIVDWAKHYSDQGKQTLVVATRTPHVLILDALLRQKLDPSLVALLFGEDTTATRNQVFDWFRATPGAVLVTPLVKEGVSINELRAGVIADPVADPEVARQIIGRFMRKKEVGNVCEITWFLDRQHSRLQANVMKLIEHLERIKGFTFYYPVQGPETISAATVHHGA